jgi:hypothetical protein
MLRRPPRIRRNLLPSACPAITLLVAVIAVNTAGLAANIGAGWPGRWIGLWADVSVVAGVLFLRWLTRARSNAESYGPAGAHRDPGTHLGAHRVPALPGWEAGAWLCPGANLWVPFRITADILRASTRADGGSGEIPAARDTPGIRLLRAWWALWLGMWLAFWGFAVSYLIADTNGLGITTWQRVIDVVFELLSIGAAACAAAVVVTITRRQAGRALDPVHARKGFPRIVPVGWLALGCVPLAVVALLTVARVPAGGTLAPAGVSLTRQEMAGQWLAADGGVLIFSPEGAFRARNLSVNLATGDPAGPARWSGTGTWQPPTPGSAPWVSLTAGQDDGMGFTVGTPASPAILVKMGEVAINADDGDESDYYTFSKAAVRTT